MTDFYLAYHGSSQKYADNIATMLKRSNYEIKHIPILGEAGPYLSELLAPLKKPIIILISDNLLKSTICMYDGLNVLKSLIKDELIYPIVVKGIYGDESGVKKVDTNFSKVSDVIN
ncbi:MAG: hypothetical protein KJP00_12230, partial [Bacteroidia bacterium]|nr:hypothetical protein [Bacteroidia bacterium]